MKTYVQDFDLLKSKLSDFVCNNIEKTATGCWKIKNSTRNFRIDGNVISLVNAIFLVYRPQEISDYIRPEIGRTCGNVSCFSPEHLYYKTIWHRFWEKVNKLDDDECWNWTHAKDGGGYGIFVISSSPFIKEKAHRYSWNIHIGNIPKGKHVLHKCDNPACVNPKHLFLGTNADNVRDKMSKNRFKPMLGVQNGMCKLTPDQVIEIRILHTKGISYKELSKKFHIGNTQIGRIIRRESWVWL